VSNFALKLPRRGLIVWPMLSIAAVLSCSSPSSIKPFATDGCSLFPDRSLISQRDWCSCCVVHDLAYWRGGTAEQRLNADRELQTCVARSTGNKALSELMFTGVRAGGGPYYFTTYRWGYGWPYGREYKPLTSAEAAAADDLEKQYQANHPALACIDTSASKP